MNGNSFIRFLLNSPLHGLMSGSTLLITVAGRKTGRPVTLPVNYARQANTLWVISKRDRTWWRNLIGGAPVKLRLRGREFEAHAEAIQDEGQVAEQLPAYLAAIPISARSLGIRVTAGQPEQEDLRRAARQWLVVRITLKE